MSTPRIRKPKLPLTMGQYAAYPRLYDAEGYALTPREAEWAAREATAAPVLRRALRATLDELRSYMGGPNDMDENELALLLDGYRALGPRALAKFKRDFAREASR